MRGPGLIPGGIVEEAVPWCEACTGEMQAPGQQEACISPSEPNQVGSFVHTANGGCA